MKKKTSYLSTITKDGTNPAVLVCDLDAGKSIVRIESPRKFEWWVVLGYDSSRDDNKCILVQKSKFTKFYKSNARVEGDLKILKEYAPRVSKVHVQWDRVRDAIKRTIPIVHGMVTELKRTNRQDEALKQNIRVRGLESLLCKIPE